MKCVDCGRKAPHNHVKCMYCGGALESAVFEDHVIQCPGCTSTMEKHEIGGITIDICPDCEGVWLDKGELEQLLVKKPELMCKPRESGAETPQLGRSQQYRSCPRCAEVMLLKNYKRYSGVLIDQCGKHGSYLDAGEISKIFHFIENGGLEKVASKEREERAFRASRRYPIRETLRSKHEDQSFFSMFVNFVGFL